MSASCTLLRLIAVVPKHDLAFAVRALAGMTELVVHMTVDIRKKFIVWFLRKVVGHVGG